MVQGDFPIKYGPKYSFFQTKFLPSYLCDTSDGSDSCDSSESIDSTGSIDRKTWFSQNFFLTKKFTKKLVTRKSFLQTKNFTKKRIKKNKKFFYFNKLFSPTFFCLTKKNILHRKIFTQFFFSSKM